MRQPSHPPPSRPPKKADLANYQDLVVRFAPDLAAVEAAIADNLSSSNELTESIAAHVVKSGGKRLRPLLVILTSRLSGYTGSDRLVLGNVVSTCTPQLCSMTTS
jgi:octaprenyl-diphosphate synthase